MSEIDIFAWVVLLPIKKRRCDKPVGSTVNVADASYNNTIGDPKQKAFYYVRVIEIPKPR